MGFINIYIKYWFFIYLKVNLKYSCKIYSASKLSFFKKYRVHLFFYATHQWITEEE